MNFIDLKAQYRRVKQDIDARIHRVLDHGQYIMGPEVAELEERLAAYAGVKHCIGISDGTTALQVAMMALQIEPGDEIITTPFTFIATGETIALIGAKPVFVDIDPTTFNLDPALIEAAITPRTKAILPVSLYGQCADMDAINAIAARHGLPVIEDAAQSFGATQRGRRSGALTTIGTTSFFPSKPLGCYGDGGACFTDDDTLAKRMREIRLHGQDRRYHHPLVGLNGRLDTIQAAVLLGKLTIFEDEVQGRGRIGAAYSRLITSRLGEAVAPPLIAEDNTCVYAQYTVRLHAPLERARIVEHLKSAGVPTAVHYPIPLHQQPAMARVAVVPAALPFAEQAAREVISLPMHPYLAESELDTIVSALAVAVERQ